MCSRVFLACVDHTRFRFEWRKRFAPGSPRFTLSKSRMRSRTGLASPVERNAVVDRSAASVFEMARARLDPGMSRCSSLVEEDVRTRSSSWRMMRRMASSRALALSSFSLGPSLGKSMSDQKSHSGKNCCPFKMYMPMRDDLYQSGSAPASSLKLGVCSRNSPKFVKTPTCVETCTLPIYLMNSAPKLATMERRPSSFPWERRMSA